jgi:hypothetical protein
LGNRRTTRFPRSQVALGNALAHEAELRPFSAPEARHDEAQLRRQARAQVQLGHEEKNCNITNTGASNSASATGIESNASHVRIIGNSIAGFSTTSAGIAVGISCGAVTGAKNAIIENNSVTNTTLISNSTGIATVAGNTFIVNNRISGMTTGIAFEGEQGTGKYRDNIVTADATTLYSGGTDAGNNH